MLALVDGDIVAYRCAASAELDDDWIATSRIDKLLDEIFRATGSDSSRIFISGGLNYRYKIYPQYKANRPEKKPRWLQMCKEYMVKEWSAEFTDGIEADDALAMSQTNETVICSIDKDLLQIPGKHYRFVKGEYVDVDLFEGLRSFYRNLLIGDTTDNIRGVDQIGKKRAAKLINPQDNEQDMFDIVREQYNDDERLCMNGQLMWLQRYKDDVWNNAKNLFTNSGWITKPEEEHEHVS